MMTLYGYYHCPCIFESASALVSLHRTKAGAWKAMNRTLWQIAETHADMRRLHGQTKGHKPFSYESWAVLPVEVMP